MDFLDFCQRAADSAQEEAALKARLGAAHAGGDDAGVVRLTGELECATIEKRFAVLRAIDCAQGRSQPT